MGLLNELSSRCNAYSGNYEIRPIQLYRPKGKGEIRFVYRAISLNNNNISTRHQKSYSINRLTEEGAWAAAQKAYDYCKEYNRLPADIKLPASAMHQAEKTKRRSRRKISDSIDWSNDCSMGTALSFDDQSCSTVQLLDEHTLEEQEVSDSKNNCSPTPVTAQKEGHYLDLIKKVEASVSADDLLFCNDRDNWEHHNLIDYQPTFVADPCIFNGPNSHICTCQPDWLASTYSPPISQEVYSLTPSFMTRTDVTMKSEDQLKYLLYST